ncbi:hypothetical protein M422DRAFT_257374 [Sphaerobolus stellatus SS14]|uniref:Uncharacterized protein n=1 Tax=Sphaerobolus stellatus (strain SS14) TaxID=990650 RepID=A0A0C9U9M5_SPHS4|nr:hypothetical protein M422DRAFT_257374 [Sphaerobolus stellatus SS14]
MSYAPPAVPPYPTNFDDQRQYQQDPKPPVPQYFHPEHSAVSPMPERIMPNLPADQAHSIQPATPSPPRPIRLSTTEAIWRIPARPQSPRTSSAAPALAGHLARPQSAFDSHPVPLPPDRYGASPAPYAPYNAGDAGAVRLAGSSSAAQRCLHAVALQGRTARRRTTLPVPRRSTHIHSRIFTLHRSTSPKDVSPNSPELTASIPTKDTLLAAQKILTLIYGGITNHLLEILVMMVECMDNTNSTLLRLTVTYHRLYDHINPNHLELLHHRLETRRSQCFSMIHILYLGNF